MQEIDNISELSKIRKIIDCILFIYLMGTSVWALVVYNKTLVPNLSAGKVIIYYVSNILVFMGIISLLPINNIIKIFKRLFNFRWKRHRVIFIISAYFIGNLLIMSLNMMQQKQDNIIYNETESLVNDYNDESEAEDTDNVVYDEENDYTITEPSYVQDEENSDYSSYNEEEESTNDEITSSAEDNLYSTDADAITKAREYFAENVGEYDDLQNDMHMISVETIEGTDDYRIEGRNFSVDTNQCVMVESDNKGNVYYYFYEHFDYMDMYIKIVHDIDYDTIYYGESFETCSDICGQF